MAERSAGLELFSPVLAPEIDDHWILVQRVRLLERFVQSALEVEGSIIQNSTTHRRADVDVGRAKHGRSHALDQPGVGDEIPRAGLVLGDE